MSELRVRKGGALRGEVRVPGDKSISHRALILGALADGENRVRGWLAAGDTLATLDAMRTLGIDVQRENGNLRFHGGTLRAPGQPVNCGNAGTAIRLLAGLLAGQSFASVLDGSEQLRARPMRRVTAPLAAMGADIEDTDGRAPLTIYPARLAGCAHRLNVASAQVKSAILLAGLQAEGWTTVIEPGPSRDHTERMLCAMGADVRIDGLRVTVAGGGAPLQPLDLTIPGDLSSAAFVIVAAALVPGSDVRMRGVGLNPTRTGLLDVLRRMGADISVEDRREEGGELVGTVRVRGGDLAATEIAGQDVVRAIDELPILAVAATQAEGETVIRDAAELRVKEVDRISLLAGELRRFGAAVEERPDGMIIGGRARLRGAAVHSHGDHRLAMAMAVAGLVAEGETVVQGADCADDSFPGFAATLARLGAEVG
ncbi:MAG TPA: 3-phosphoshikimate 1-carboxyvinyltransferase [Aggregatilineales bacterium]|nr:3-phosphoshikimate 1-carboxyvinyltransferase [Aggregatilineales bacterium]HQE19539.1 3-phosphoshikimate 1-carboxyvinyltransferase [Aggregatilineales bacterium]